MGAKHFSGLSMKLSLVLSMVLLSGPLVAQTEMEVKTSGNYFWGEGEASTLEDAREGALKELVNGISVTVSSSTRMQASENDEGLSQNFESLTETVSRLTLQGVAYLTKERRGRQVAIAYISKADYRKSITAMAEEIQETLSIVERSQPSLARLYEIYLRCYFSPEPVPFQTARAERYKDARLYLKQQITDQLAEVTLKLGSLQIDASVDLVTLPVQLSRQGRPADGLEVKVVGSGEPPTALPGGAGNLYLYSLPTAPQLSLPIAISVDLNSDADADLVKMKQIYPLEHVRQVAVDFSDHIIRDFSVQLMANGALLFDPVYQNFSLSGLAWDFGDGSTSSSTKPLHRFKSAGPHTVVLTFNNRRDFIVEKRVWADGRVEKVDREKAVPIVAAPPVDQAPEQLESDLPALPAVMGNLQEAQNYQTLVKRLEAFKRIHKLMYGKKSTFLYPEQCYIVIVNPKDGAIQAFLGPGEESRVNLATGEAIHDMSRFKGNASIYVEIYDAQ